MGDIAKPFATIKEAIDAVPINTPTVVHCWGANPDVGTGLISLTDKDIYVDARGKDITYDHDVFDTDGAKDFALHCQNITSSNGSALIITPTKTAKVIVDGTITNNNTGVMANLSVFRGLNMDLRAYKYVGTAPLFTNIGFVAPTDIVCELDYIDMAGGCFSTIDAGTSIKLGLKVNKTATATVSGATAFIEVMGEGTVIEGDFNITGIFFARATVSYAGKIKNSHIQVTDGLVFSNDNITLENTTVDCATKVTSGASATGWVIDGDSRINCNVAGFALVLDSTSSMSHSTINNTHAAGDGIDMNGGIAINSTAIKSSSARTGFLALGVGSVGNKETPTEYTITNPATPYAPTPYELVTEKPINIDWDCTASNMVLDLPLSVNSSGLRFTIIKTDASVNTITITPNGAELINGSATAVITAQWDSVDIWCNGAEWFIS